MRKMITLFCRKRYNILQYPVKNIFKKQYGLILNTIVLVCFAGFAFAEEEFDEKTNRLIGYMLYKQLPAIHFSDKRLDNSLSKAAFSLYLKQLDYQKRFLLQEDVDQLNRFRMTIDDNLGNGNIVLPKLGYTLLSDRLLAAERLAKEVMAKGFDVEKDEYYETDPDKLTYAVNEKELEDRWRKTLKARVISRYLDLLEDEKDKEDRDFFSEQTLNKKLWDKAMVKVEKSIAQLFTRLHQETLQDHYDRFFSALTRAFDPHTSYMPPAKKEDFDIHMRGSLEGIGAMLREEDGYIKVVRIMAGSASARQGMLQAEDVILQVAEADGEPVEITDMRLNEAVRLIRGPKGTEVRLTVKKPDGKQVLIPIVRDVVQIEETFVKSTVLDIDGVKTGYIMIPSFYRDFEGTKKGKVVRNSTDDTRKALIDLKKQGIEGLILDLRDNGGGSLVDAVDTTGLFLKDGPVVQVKNSFGSRKVLDDEDDTLYWDGPMVVLVNIFSASASEILAAALQDYGRAVIIGGKHTHGKGTVQTIIDMNDNIPLLYLHDYPDLGALKVTIQKFYRINGGSTQYKGVVPDIILPSLYEYLQSGEKYLDNSLPWDQVSSLSYLPYDSGHSGRKIDISELQKRSLARLEHEAGLKIIAEEAARAKEKMEETSFSLLFSDMQRQRQMANESRDKVGVHYKKYKKNQTDSSKNDGRGQEDSEKWADLLYEDPYVLESVHVLEDMEAAIQSAVN